MMVVFGKHGPSLQFDESHRYITCVGNAMLCPNRYVRRFSRCANSLIVADRNAPSPGQDDPMLSPVIVRL